MITITRKTILLFVILLSGCTLPGEYFDESDLSELSYKLGLSKKKIAYVELTPDLVFKHKLNHVEPYRIGPFDVLSIIVWGHNDLTYPITKLSDQKDNGILVDAEGYIFFPWVGRVKVAGLTFTETRDLLIKKLNKYIKVPQVSVRNRLFRSHRVQVIGEVQRSRNIILTDRPVSVMEAISETGGILLDSANNKQIYIIRSRLDNAAIFLLDLSKPPSFIAAKNFNLYPDDVIYVSSVGLAQWRRVMSSILPSTAATSQIGNTFVVQ